MYETRCQSRFDARYWMLGASALGRPRGMVWGGRREEGSGWGTHVYLWRIHFDIWQNEYNYVNFKNKIKLKKNKKIKHYWKKKKDTYNDASVQYVQTLSSSSLVVVQSLSLVQLFATPRTAAHWALLSFTISRSLLKFMYIESVMLSNHLILCHCLLLLPSIFPSIKVFSSESALRIRWPNIGASDSASVLPVNIQGWFPLGLTGLIFLLSKGLSRVFSSTTVQKHQFFGTQLLSGPALTSVHDYWKNQ